LIMAGKATKSFDALLGALEADEYIGLPVSALEPDEEQDRKDFDSEEARKKISELAASMAHETEDGVYGVRRAIEVTEIGAGRYRIISGERRWRAANLAGLTEVPCVIRRNISTDVMSLDQLTENILRENLSLWELASALKKRIDGGLKGKDLAARLGKSAAWVSKYTSVMKMSESVQKLAENRVVRNIETLQLIDALEPDDKTVVIKSIMGGEDPQDALQSVQKNDKPVSGQNKADKKPQMYVARLSAEQASRLLEKMGYGDSLVSPTEFGSLLSELLQN